MPGTSGIGGGPDPFANIPPPELEFDADIDVGQNVRALGEQAQKVAEDGLSVAEQESLVAAAQNMLDQPELPAGDRQALENFLTKLQNTQTSSITGSETEEINPQLAQELLSTDPQVVEDALDALFGTKIPPEQRQRLKESGAFARMAANIAQRNGQEPQGASGLKSWDPEVINHELQRAFDEAELEVGDGDEQMAQDLAALQGALSEVADDVATMNVLNGEVPEMNPFSNTLSTSTNPEEIANALLDEIDTSSMTADELADVEEAIGEIARQLASANESGESVEGLGSASATRIKNALVAMLGEDVDTSDTSAVGRALGQAAGKISDANARDLAFSAIGGGIGGSGMFGPVSGANAYMTPGIMAMLAPLLSELAELMAEIIKQSSELKQAMMNLTLSMAQEAYTFAIAAGEAKVEQLEIEVQQALVNIGISAGTIVMGAAQVGAQQRTYNNAARKFEGNAGMPRNPDQFPPGRDGAMAQHSRKMELQNDIDATSPGSAQHAKAVQAYNKEFYPEPNPAFQNGKPTPAFLKSSEMQEANTKVSQMAQTGTMFINAGKEALQNANTAIHTNMKMDPVMEEATMNAMKDFISQLMQTIADTMRSAGEAGQSADKAWESFNQLFKEMASTITRSIYQG